jgi:anti-sigma regulatory factor (Ser/Thr protein kinase)
MMIDGSARWVLSVVEPLAESVPYVRQQTSRVLRLWRLDDLAWAVELLATELATNVVRHARTLFTVNMSWGGHTLRFEISDASPLPPRLQLDQDVEATGGRGLLLVDTVASAWGVDRHAQGKTVWFELDRRETSR